jgi:hypothetical protein
MEVYRFKDVHLQEKRRMDANNNSSSDQPLTLKEIREQKRLIKAQLELHQLQRARRVLEASTNADYWLSSYVDLLDRYRDGDRLGYPISQPTDRRYGQNWPFWSTETQLSLFRAQARYLCSTNSYAIGLLGGLQAYVIGDGFQYRVVSKEKHGGKPSSLIAQVQAIVDEFCEVNQWWDWEQELFWRSREDGEYFLRYYPDNELQCLTVRSVEPEQVCTTGIPEGAAGEWSFGILTDPEDVQEIFAYNVLYLASPAEHGTDIREEVPVEDLQHFKINVRRTIKRGLTDFCYSTYDALHLAEKLRNNLAEGAAVQAALAYIRQHESATQAQVQNFLNTQQLDFSRTNPLTGLSINYKHLEPGSVVDIPRGMQYVQPPGAGNASGFVEILHASLRGAGCRWNAPEWLATASGGDMAAYTASLTAHAPFVRTATQKQKSYKQAYTRVIKEAIQVAIDYGRLPPETFDIIDIQCEAPSIPAKSELDEAQANQIRVQGGWKSRQTVQQEEGLDPQREMQNIEEYNRRMGADGKSGPVPVREANFNPNEPRDQRGRWTQVGDRGTADSGEPSLAYFPPATSEVVTTFSSPMEEQPGNPREDHRPRIMIARAGQYLIISYPDGHQEHQLAPTKEDVLRILTRLGKTYQILVPKPPSQPSDASKKRQENNDPLQPFLGEKDYPVDNTPPPGKSAEQQQAENEAAWDSIQADYDRMSLLPAIGAGFSLVNSAISAIRGKWRNAANDFLMAAAFGLGGLLKVSKVLRGLAGFERLMALLQKTARLEKELHEAARAVKIAEEAAKSAEAIAKLEKVRENALAVYKEVERALAEAEKSAGHLEKEALNEVRQRLSKSKAAVERLAPPKVSIKTQWGWMGSNSWKDAVKTVASGGQGGEIRAIAGKIPTYEEAVQLIKEAGGTIQRVEGPHIGSRVAGHIDYNHINFTTANGMKSHLAIQSLPR